MNTIYKLDKNLINQISAWEVVERPASVVKELIENSIDAKATNIKVEIFEWWKKQILINDDWIWLDLEDLEICLDKYTTSKIKSLDDLYNVLTFWFRWEALASISSVSEIYIISKTKNSNNANKIEYSNEKWKILTKSSHNEWTTISVSNLFYNTPARLNYLKQDRTEYAKILSYLENIALIHPEIWMEFFSDWKKIFKYNKNETILERIYSIYWEEFSNNILEINFELWWINVNWYISDPKTSFNNKNKQHIFVNKRPISSIIISKAVNDAYNRFIPHNSFPAYIIDINVNPTIIDVNVHPRKQEIRFENEQAIFKAIYHAIHNNLERISLITNSIELSPFLNKQEINESISNNENKIEIKNNNDSINIPENKTKHFTWSWTNFKEFSPYKNVSNSINQQKISDWISFTKNLLENDKKDLFEKSLENQDIHYTKLWKIIWQAFNSYIIVENEWKIVILDQHALAERINYEKLIKIDNKWNSQKLLIPESIKINTIELDLLLDNLDTFSKMWFEIEILWNWIISVYSIPEFIKKENIKELFLSILWDLTNWNLKSKTLDEVKNKIFAYTACRSAIKFWNKLNLFEMNKLLNESIDNYSSTCPHWRPVIYEIWLNELKDKYER